MKRRNFIKTSGAVVAGSMLLNPSGAMAANFAGKKTRVALVGTGVRGISFWGKTIVENFSDIVEYVGLCDINPGRLAFGKSFMGVDCPTFTNFDEMMKQTKPDMLIVTTVDSTHHEFIIKGLEYGAEVLTEKPFTTDEVKCQAILDAEKKYNKKVTVGFNYRFNPHYTKLRELLKEKRVGKLTSVDFHWYLNVYHGASYFRRWHGLREHSGTLLIHKASHHFDLLNWWIDSDPVEVSAYGMLEHYGKNNPFRGAKCRGCEHKDKCKFFWDITGNEHLMKLYVENEHHDGYIRDSCVWRNEIDIFDKMSVQIKYANDVQVNYSLTTYSPYEGMTIAFNGMNGRIDSWDGIPWRRKEKLEQAELHTKEMSQDKENKPADYEEIFVSDNFGETNLLKVPRERGGHGGGDKRLHDRVFRNPESPDPYGHFAGSRDGAMSILIGTAARKSIDEGRPIKIADLTDLVPYPSRGV
ncbi:MAG: Gfo/Idh/MocA family oxidoreductase [Bacteroidales bacterium]|nr:Gfo/Idh/MocA family oxidoreductase [Bacteroidales bacterium]